MSALPPVVTHVISDNVSHDAESEPMLMFVSVNQFCSETSPFKSPRDPHTAHAIIATVLFPRSTDSADAQSGAKPPTVLAALIIGLMAAVGAFHGAGAGAKSNGSLNRRDKKGRNTLLAFFSREFLDGVAADAVVVAAGASSKTASPPTLAVALPRVAVAPSGFETHVSPVLCAIAPRECRLSAFC
jgi:hypothetical protein